MSAWRRKAVALFPKLTTSLEKADYTIYRLYFDLFPESRDAHVRDDVEALRRIYGFAEWCLHQQPKELWNPAGVAFFEHVFDDPSLRAKVVEWSSPSVIAEVRGLWEARLGADAMKEIDRLFASRRRALYRESTFASGEVNAL